jgi:regulator of RNase E activity RraA
MGDGSGAQDVVRGLTDAQLAFLVSVDSPTIANAIERFEIRPRTEGFIGGSVRSVFPELGPIGMVTDGELRDVDEVRMLGFHYFMQYPVVSHANFEVAGK